MSDKKTGAHEEGISQSDNDEATRLFFYRTYLGLRNDLKYTHERALAHLGIPQKKISALHAEFGFPEDLQ